MPFDTNHVVVGGDYVNEEDAHGRDGDDDGYDVTCLILVIVGNIPSRDAIYCWYYCSCS